MSRSTRDSFRPIFFRESLDTTSGVPTFDTRVAAMTTLGGADIVIFLSEKQLFPTLAQEPTHA